MRKPKETTQARKRCCAVTEEAPLGARRCPWAEGGSLQRQLLGWFLASGRFELTVASATMQGNTLVLSAGGISFCQLYYWHCGSPCATGPRPWCFHLCFLALASPSRSLRTTPGTIKPSLFPLRVKLSVPKWKGNGLILLNMLQKIFVC